MVRLKKDEKHLYIEKCLHSLEELPAEQSKVERADPQLISLKTALTQILEDMNLIKILDFGCGKGTLIPILCDILKCNDYNCTYIGVNVPEIEDELKLTFSNSCFFGKEGSTLLNFSDFLENRDLQFNVIVIKNVTHEIQYIKKMGEIIFRLLKMLQKNGKIVIQDMELLPEAELGNCPYMISGLKELFEENGLRCTENKYHSFSGIPLFTLIGTKTEEPKSKEVICKKLLSIRKIQRSLIKHKLHKQIENKKTDETVRCVTEHLDYFAIEKQITDYESDQSQQIMSPPIMADKLSDEKNKYMFMSEEYLVQLIVTLNVNVEPDDILHISGASENPMNSGKLDGEIIV
ncbi:MAG: hypothetical protein AEth_01715 [Candidatus Argoarchaeum ethanivorans]|uniref:Methyltransferase domain-containing protein n=1 Tax=Candidatus Argoarchaeum ethanivorans TaxID=2608793 RepID=A0A8B3RZA0_9EURY|nr:MAG: hypothetical protein AEth_01715 [Candidatus Argoarchaeum ethanivorans]